MWQHVENRVKLRPRHVPTTQTATQTPLVTVLILNPLNTQHTLRAIHPKAPLLKMAQNHPILAPTMARCDFSNLPVQPLSSLPYPILRLHIGSLAYQQLSDGGASIPTCHHQHRFVELDQTQREGRGRTAGVGQGLKHPRRLNRRGRVVVQVYGMQTRLHVKIARYTDRTSTLQPSHHTALLYFAKD
jgi:hypothetical protein